MEVQKKGFTLIELVIVIVVVAILALVSISIFQYHTERARVTEAYSMLRAIADANTLYYLEHKAWCNDITLLPVEIEGKILKNKDGLNRIETENFIYASSGDSTASKTIATVNRKPFKERYWFSLASVPTKENPKLGNYNLTGSATYNKSKDFDKKIVEEYLKKYPKTK